MVITDVHIENFKTLRDFDLSLNDDLNIIVGDNEAGKSTIIEAINLALTLQLNGRYILNEISPFLFNLHVVEEYIATLKTDKGIVPPRILVELYLKETPQTAKFKGTNNTKRKDVPGIFIAIEMNENCFEEYKLYIQSGAKINTIPSEFYHVIWQSFDFNTITSSRTIPIKTSLIDTTNIRLQNGADGYINKILDDALNPNERIGLSLMYRELKQEFAQKNVLQSINARLNHDNDRITTKDLTLSLDISNKTSWESSLTSYIDKIPFTYIGKGEQSVLKMMLALGRDKSLSAHVLLIEEPETHLSHSTMSQLIKKISTKCIGKQVILTTHSAYVANKLGLEKLIIVNNSNTLPLSSLTDETQNYFRKLPGFDTLRFVLSKTVILVEGPSDELIVQYAYLKRHSKLPLEDGIDVLSVGLSFKRFLEIAVLIKKKVIVITDNDGNCKTVEAKFKNYLTVEHQSYITICYSKDESLPTLEPHIVNCNDLATINKILGKSFTTKEDVLSYLSSNKTETALTFFSSKTALTIPNYINDAIPQ